jgi:hypothetical protein
MFKKFILPVKMPNKKILSVDIGGTLAKTAFYIPKQDIIRTNQRVWEKITDSTIPSKMFFIFCSRT